MLLLLHIRLAGPVVYRTTGSRSLLRPTTTTEPSAPRPLVVLDPLRTVVRVASRAQPHPLRCAGIVCVHLPRPGYPPLTSLRVARTSVVTFGQVPQ